jgi:signal transduction histidine kinase
MTLRTKIVALVLGLTAFTLGGLGLFLAGSWSGWSRQAVERDLADRARALAGRVEAKKDGELELEDEHSAIFDDPAHPYRIVGPGGVVQAKGDLAWPPPEERQDLVRDREGRSWRVVSRLLPVGEDERRHRGEPLRIAVQVAGIDAPHGALEERFRHGLLVALLAALALGGVGAAVLAHLSLAPLRRLASEVDAMGASSLDRRVGAAGLDRELGRLASAFNDLLGRLDDAMQRQRQLVSRASHALRTPTATILTQAEVALRRERQGPEYREALAEIAAAARESAALVGHLLTLARLDERSKALQLEDLAVAEVAAELVRLLRPRADEAGIALELDAPGDLVATAERAALRSCSRRCLDNALHYTPRGAAPACGRPRSRAASPSRSGTPAPASRPRSGPRSRPPPSRGSARAGEREGGGAGSGLAIAKAIAEAHGDAGPGREARGRARGRGRVPGSLAAGLLGRKAAPALTAGGRPGRRRGPAWVAP